MGPATLVLPEAIARELRAMLAEPRESAAVLLIGSVTATDGQLRLLGRELYPVPEEGYELREPTELLVSSTGFMPALARAQEIGASALWFHTHPGAKATAERSPRDERVDEALAETFRLRSASEIYASMILSGTPEHAHWTGRVIVDGRPRPLQRLWEVGERLRLTQAGSGARAVVENELLDRNVRAFGGAVQQTLSSLSVGLVGAGGTGSAVAEQLIRLGVRRLTVLDPDTLSTSNLTRVYGSTPEDVGAAKTSVLGRHLRRIAPDATVHEVPHKVSEENAARALVGCDVVFGCTDDNAGRLVLSRLASYLLTPVIDCGVLLSSGPGGTLEGIDARVTVLSPGAGCLVCRDRIDLARAQAEQLPPEERSRLQREGYAAALPGVEPAVVAYTTAVAAAAVGELIERLVGYGPEPVPSEVLLRLHEREISVNRAEPRPGHYCDRAAGKLGIGDRAPFLEQTWAA
jgi:hypothetical protein